MAVSQESLVQVMESTNGRLCVYWDEFRGQRLLHVRYWYQDKKDGQFKPGMKGAGIPESAVPQFLKALKQVLASDHGKEEG